MSDPSLGDPARRSRAVVSNWRADMQARRYAAGRGGTSLVRFPYAWRDSRIDAALVVPIRVLANGSCVSCGRLLIPRSTPTNVTLLSDEPTTPRTRN